MRICVFEGGFSRPTRHIPKHQAVILVASGAFVWFGKSAIQAKREMRPERLETPETPAKAYSGYEHHIEPKLCRFTAMEQEVAEYYIRQRESMAKRRVENTVNSLEWPR